MCNHPLTIKNPKTGEYIQVPCGHCIGCLVDMQSEWATRLTIHYQKDNRPACFITLTYNDDNLPTEEYNKEGVMYDKPSVVKIHIQQFIRSLRTYLKRHKLPSQIEYFFTSEYGPTGGRPHYHGIIFGLDKSYQDIYERIWRKGFVHVGDCNEATITYCCKYCCKPIEVTKYPDRKGYFDNEKWMDEMGIRRKPFRLMSKNLGLSYCKDRENLKFHFRRIYENSYIRLGKLKKKVPRYMKLKIYTMDNLEKYGSRKEYINMIREIHKKDKEYGYSYIYYSLDAALGRLKYYRHLADDIKGYEISENYFKRTNEAAEKREYLLTKNRLQWFRRPGRYHEGS